MLKYVVAGVILTLLWGATLLFDLPMVIPVLGTVVVLLAVVSLILFRRWKARSAAKNLEKALAAQAVEHARHVRPDLQGDVAEIQAEFQKAITALKTSTVGGGGTSALYALPWYVIVGPPGAGKTTALRNSGLSFPYLSQKGGGVRGVGGTRNCDWWLTNEGVLLDTAGRWTTEDDRNEWLGFLDLLRKYRPRKPLNGLIVAVSVDLLAGGSEQEVSEVGRRIRARVDEAMDHLQMSLPVYVMFTKCDLVPGFVETFDEMSKSERSQMWGFTTPLQSNASDPAELFEKNFDELGQALEHRMLKRLGDERKLERRESIFAFPKQFATLAPSLKEFVSTLFEENVFKETPMLRGCYFVSGTQEGRPIDRVMHRIADALGIAPNLDDSTAATANPKSYFLTNIFKRVIFADADIAIRSASEQKRKRLTNFAVSGAILFCALLLLTLPVMAWSRNVDLIEEVANSVTETEAAIAAANEAGERLTPTAFDGLLTAAGRLDELDESTPFLMTFGMYAGDDLRSPLRAYIARSLRGEVVEPIRQTGVDQIERLQQRYARNLDDAPSAVEHRQAYNRLKTELLLSRPTLADQPALDADVQTYITNRLQRLWTTEGADPSPEAARLIGIYVNELATDETLGFRRDPALVTGVRHILGRVSGEQLAVDGLIERFDSQPPTTVRSILGSTVPHVRGRQQVRAAFTIDVWKSHIQAMLDQPLDLLVGETWVLGSLNSEEPSTEERERQQREVAAEYFARYIDEWRQFIRGVYTVPARNGNRGALSQLQDLTRGEPSPFAKLFLTVERNVNLNEPEPEGVDVGETETVGQFESMFNRAANSTRAGRVAAAALRDAGSATEGGTEQSSLLVKEDIRPNFEGFFSFSVSDGEPSDPTSLDVYEEQLLFVRDALQTHLDDPSDPNALAARLQQARTRTQGLIAGQEVGWRPVFNAMLWPPVDGASMSFSQASGLGAGRAWCNDVVAPFQRMLAGRYPLTANGSDLSFSDFADFYRPETGTLWTYFTERLDGLVERNGDRFSFEARLGRPAASVMKRSLLNFLQQSQSISRAFFPSGATDPTIEMDVRIRPSPRLASVTFSLSGEEFEYHNGPEEWRRFTWPGEDPTAGASIEARGEGLEESVEQNGDWGLFHLIERGSVTSRGGARVFSVEWRLGSNDVSIAIDFRPSRSDNPFFAPNNARGSIMGTLRSSNANVPREVVNGRRVCPNNGG